MCCWCCCYLSHGMPLYPFQPPSSLTNSRPAKGGGYWTQLSIKTFKLTLIQMKIHWNSSLFLYVWDSNFHISFHTHSLKCLPNMASFEGQLPKKTVKTSPIFSTFWRIWMSHPLWPQPWLAAIYTPQPLFNLFLVFIISTSLQRIINAVLCGWQH